MARWTPRLRGPHIVLPYLGYGTASKLALCGRVLEDDGVGPARSRDRRWRNLVAMYRRFESDEVPGARVRARHGGSEAVAVADHEGYFAVELETAPGSGMWRDVRLELVSPRGGASAIGRALVPPPSARYGIISDIDDTVVQTHVVSKLRMVVGLALSNARTRKPFQGVGAFYRALHAGMGSECNPIFYVSKSPWNLYVPLVEYLQVQGIPLGPLLLRDYGLHMVRSRADHKSRSIDRVLATYPRMPFVLIGDSGEQDPEIYAGVVRRWPGRVRAIYIRSVHRKAARLAAIDRLIEEVRPTGCQLVLVPDSEFAAAHAAGEGLIAAAALGEIRRDKAAEARRPPPEAAAGAMGDEE